MSGPSPVRLLVLLCLAIGTTRPSGVTASEPPSPEAVARWVRELNDPSPGVRAVAIAELTAAEDAALEAVVAASTDPVLQRAAEAVAILQTWAFPSDPDAATTADESDVWHGLAGPADEEDNSDLADDPNGPATDVSAVREVAPPTPLQQAAERQLSELAISATNRVAPLARAALTRHQDERHRRAVRAIRALGGGILFTDAGFYNDRTARNRWQFQNIRPGGAIGPGGLFPPGPAIAPNQAGDSDDDEPAAKRLSRITIGRDWTGGEDGLYHLIQLEQAPSFDLRIEGKPPGVPTEAVSRLLARMDNLAISYASAATLGISGNSATPLKVEQVTPGGSCALAGVLSGDIIRQLGDDPVRSLPHVKSLLMKYEPGQPVPLTVDRRGRILELSVTLQDWSRNDKFRP